MEYLRTCTSAVSMVLSSVDDVTGFRGFFQQVFGDEVNSTRVAVGSSIVSETVNCAMSSI